MSFFSKLFGSSEKVDFQALIGQGAKIVDVRTPQEFKGGHVKGSVNIPLNTLAARIEEVKRYGKPVIVCCQSGMRASQALSALKNAGVEAYNAGSWMSL